jgi:hypothetical protein
VIQLTVPIMILQQVIAGLDSAEARSHRRCFKAFFNCFLLHNWRLSGRMKITRLYWMLLALVLVFLCLAPFRMVYAYVDPGTGSYVLQLLLAAFFGLLFTVKIFWAKIKGAFKGIQESLKKRREN